MKYSNITKNTENIPYEAASDNLFMYWILKKYCKILKSKKKTWGWIKKKYLIHSINDNAFFNVEIEFNTYIKRTKSITNELKNKERNFSILKPISLEICCLECTWYIEQNNKLKGYSSYCLASSWKILSLKEEENLHILIAISIECLNYIAYSL